MLTQGNFRTRWSWWLFWRTIGEAYAESDQFEIVFIAVKRKAIAESGLTIITDENEITVFQILFQMIR
jgi:hypothetical protein